MIIGIPWGVSFKKLIINYYFCNYPLASISNQETDVIIDNTYNTAVDVDLPSRFHSITVIDPNLTYKYYLKDLSSYISSQHYEYPSVFNYDNGNICFYRTNEQFKYHNIRYLTYQYGTNRSSQLYIPSGNIIFRIPSSVEDNGKIYETCFSNIYTLKADQITKGHYSIYKNIPGAYWTRWILTQKNVYLQIYIDTRNIAVFSNDVGWFFTRRIPQEDLPTVHVSAYLNKDLCSTGVPVPANTQNNGFCYGIDYKIFIERQANDPEKTEENKYYPEETGTTKVSNDLSGYINRVKLVSGSILTYYDQNDPHALQLNLIYKHDILQSAQKFSEYLSTRFESEFGQDYITLLWLQGSWINDPNGTLIVPKNLSANPIGINTHYKLSCLLYVQGINKIPKSTYSGTPTIDYLQIQDPSAYFVDPSAPPIIVNSGYILNSSYLKQDPYNIKGNIYNWSTYGIKTYYRDENGNLVPFPN